jgi:hypothetical protein
MSSTNATEVNIQAVSPELILSNPTSVGSVGAGAAAGAAPAGAAVAAAAAASVGAAAEAAAAGVFVTGAFSARTAEIDSVSSPRQTNRDSIVFNVNSPVV